MNSNQKNHFIPINPVTTFQTLQDAYGTLPYNMTNDYMFRAVLQTNNKVLRGLICSLLYLCRSFDNPKRGQNYQETMPAIHIGFLDYTLFKDCPEFYAIHKLINVKTHHVYSDNFVLSVVDLSRIDLATEEDKAYQIDYWASLFKATTWEEIKMLASENEYLSEASKTIFQLSADEQIRKRCRDREEYYQDLTNYEMALADKDATIKELLEENQKLLVKIKELEDKE